MYRQFIAAAILISFANAQRVCAETARDQVIAIVAKIQRADYEGDQNLLKKSYDELAQFSNDAQLGSRVRYWRGFAMWRRAVNGFNDSVDRQELEQDLTTAVQEFKDAIAKDAGFVEAKIGMISCLGYLAFMNMKDQARTQEFVGEMMPLLKEASDAAPDNPRLLWVRGPILWNTPPERGGGQDKAIENYEKALEICAKTKASEDALEPSWGKPELMMSLAYSYLNKTPRDVNAAERNARGAFAIVPHWHYVRDILLPQILAAKNKEP